VALVGSYGLLMMIRGSRPSASSAAESAGFDSVLDEDRLQAHATEPFANELAAEYVPSVRTVRAQFHVGQPRAQRLRAYLAVLVTG
jgi:hypothetical protein